MSLFTKLIGTNLKSLKWGQLGTKGDSTEPYVTTDINKINSSVRDRYSKSSEKDGLTIRGGQSGAKYASDADWERINKFLKDPLKGPFFLYNQVGLQKSNPLIGQSIYINPPDLESKEIADSIRHYSNGETSTLAQISKTAYGEHIPRHGDIFSYNPGTYGEIMKLQTGDDKGYEKNRLYNYYLNLFNIRSIFNNTIRYDNGQSIIDKYKGGPNSVYGLGETIIHRFVYSGNFDKIENSLKKSRNKISNFTNDNQIYKNYSLGYFDDTTDVDPRIKPKEPFNFTKPNNYTNSTGSLFHTSEYEIGNELGKTKPYTKFKSPKTLKNESNEVKGQKGLGIDLIPKGKTVKLYDYKIKENISGIKTGSIRVEDQGLYNRDDTKILQVGFSQINPFNGNINTSQSFSGYINGYSENYTSNWNDIKYNGRAEFLYNFVSYKKTASFNLQIPIFRSEDLIPTHNKLKELQSGLAGKYNNSRLGGIITKIKLGYYLLNQYCIINSINIKIPDEASWDWGIGTLAYSTLLDASFNITVIDDKIPTG
jgi:hypothetical protein